MTEQEFTEWFCKNYPKDTEIHDPMWHALRIYRAAQPAAPVAANSAANPAWMFSPQEQQENQGKLAADKRKWPGSDYYPGF